MLMNNVLGGDPPAGESTSEYFTQSGPRPGFLTIAAAGALPSDLTGSTFGVTDNIPAWALRSTT
jgi:hypothetical protein